MAGRAHAAGQGERVEPARDESRGEIGQLHPGVGRGEDLRAGPLAVEDLGPEPLGAVRAAALGQIGGPPLDGFLGDFRGLGVRRVVLPEPCLGREVAGELAVQCQRHPALVHRHGGRSGGVDPDADDLLRQGPGLPLGFAQCPPNGLVEALDIVRRVLPGQIGVLAVQEDAVLAAGVVVDESPHFRPAGDVDHHGPDAVRPIVHADRILFCTRLRHAAGSLGLARNSLAGAPSQ